MFIMSCPTHVILTLWATLLVLVRDVNSQVYVEKAAKNSLFLDLCAGATNPDVCVPQHFNYQILKTFEADCSDLLWYGNCRATVVVGTNEAVIGLVFKGPADIERFKSSANSQLPTMTFVPFGTTWGNVGDQFSEAFDRLWNGQGLGVYMQEVWAKYCDFNLLVSGHSMGSCLAQMAGVYVQRRQMWSNRKIVYYGYGTPRCGDYDFAGTVNSAIVTAWRMTWLKDNIGTMPASNGCDKSQNAKYGKADASCWYHCCNQKLMKSSFIGILSWSECDNSEDGGCNPGTTSSADHTSYWSTKTAQYDKLTCGSSKIFSPA